jgi:hypothetical protein
MPGPLSRFAQSHFGFRSIDKLPREITCKTAVMVKNPGEPGYFIMATARGRRDGMLGCVT